MSTESSFDEDAKWSIVLSKRPVAQDLTLTLRENRNALRDKRTQRDALLQQIEQARAQGSPLPQPQEDELWTQIVRLEEDIDELDTQVRATRALARHKKRAVHQAIRDIIMQRLATTILPSPEPTWTRVDVSVSTEGSGMSAYMDDQYLYLVHMEEPYLTILDKTTWEAVPIPTSILPGHGWGIHGDENYLYINHADGGFFTVIHKSDFSVVAGTPSLPGHGYNAIISNDEYIFVGHRDDWQTVGQKLTVIKKSDWSVVNTGIPDMTGTPVNLALIDNVLYIMMQSRIHEAVLINVDDWSIIPTPSAIPSLASSISFDEDYIYLVGPDNTAPEVGLFKVLLRSDFSEVTGTPEINASTRAVRVDPYEPNYVYIAHDTYKGRKFTIVDKRTWSIVPDSPEISGSGPFMIRVYKDYIIVIANDWDNQEYYTIISKGTDDNGT